MLRAAKGALVRLNKNNDKTIKNLLAQIPPAAERCVGGLFGFARIDFKRAFVVFYSIKNDGILLLYVKTACCLLFVRHMGEG